MPHHVSLSQNPGITDRFSCSEIAPDPHSPSFFEFKNSLYMERITKTWLTFASASVLLLASCSKLDLIKNESDKLPENMHGVLYG